MSVHRKTAVVQLELPSSATVESLPLTCERSFGVLLSIDGQVYPALNFRSPVNDETWREFTRQLRDCNVNRSRDSGYHGAEFIRALGRHLYVSLTAVSPRLRAFFDEAGVPRRLVIATTRPELHVLPWGALYDPDGSLLAAADVSVVQCWAPFSLAAQLTGRTLNLVSVLGADTNKMTALPLRTLPPEITRNPEGQPDILHMEEHGNAVLSRIGGAAANTVARRYANATLALLWSCYSSAANSWGESPALSLHRLGAALVLSFQAELHTLDARSIAQAFYADVFGAAASRDPESAIVGIRAAKFLNEYEFANWASMVVFLRHPLNLSALPLNGPRVPAAGWSDPATPPPSGIDATGADWPEVAALVRTLTPGAIKRMAQPNGAGNAGPYRLPKAAFAGWRGNVIRLTGVDPLPDALLAELNLTPPKQTMDTVARLGWFFSKIERYGAPLIVWTDATQWQHQFLLAVCPPRSLSFLLLYAPAAEPAFEELVDLNRLDEARAAFPALPERPSGATLLAAYYMFVRSEMPNEAGKCIAQVDDGVEKALLTANFVSRYCHLPGAEIALSDLEQRNMQEDLYRQALLAAIDAGSAQGEGRARHQLGFLMHTTGRRAEAEQLYGGALASMESAKQYDRNWYLTTGMILRDWADLLADEPSRSVEAEKLLLRAHAMHTYFGRPLEMAYALTTSARIARTKGDLNAAVARALDAANRFEECGNWRGWAGALDTLLDTLAETREAARILSIAALGLEKLRASNLKPGQLQRARHALEVHVARACWIAGDFERARLILNELTTSAPAGFFETANGMEVARLQRFLSPSVRG